MPADLETITAITSHMDARFNAQDETRSAEFREVYTHIETETGALRTKLDETSEKKCDLIERYAQQTNAAIQQVAVQLGSLTAKVDQQAHCTDLRLRALEGAAEKELDRKAGWVRSITISVIAALLGFFASLIPEWMKKGG